MRPIKIFNDPVHGFIEVPKGLLVDLIDHPYFQRLRRIRQMGLASFVYASAVHTRFSHAMGAMHLTQLALKVLIDKGVEITDDELLGAQAAMLLHDIGHGPYSHALENVLIPEFHHESMSRELMRRMNDDFGGHLKTAIEIFENRYSAKPFLHGLVSGQLDMDRMDYLMRDSFFTGVVEGAVGADRIIKTLNVVDGQLVVEHKGIYSVENFLISRRLMYWQVYLHRTALVAESMIVKIVRRAREMIRAGEKIWADDRLRLFFLADEFRPELVDHFVQLDDADILYAIKQWQTSPDRALAELCNRLLSRKLLKLRFYETETPPAEVSDYLNRFARRMNFSLAEAAYFVFTHRVSNRAYLAADEPISILMKDGSLKDILNASDMPNITALSQQVVKQFYCFPVEMLD